MKPEVKKLLIALAIPLGVGGLSALLSGGMQDYLALEKPPLSPPGWVFPVVWTVLYLLMGYASYRVAVKGADAGKTRRALAVYAAQLVLNFLWSILFFGLELRLTAFFLLIGLWLLIFWTIRRFSKIDETAADLLLPYILWVTFAAYLNLGVFLLN